jgi:uncharacterized protein YndB with AHSA1/START domain
VSSFDAAVVTTIVAVDPRRAFEVFMTEVDLWWKKGPRFRFDPTRDGTLRFEPGVGGRLIESYAAGDEFVVGRVLAWEPGRRLAFEFRGRTFAPHEATEVEVLFEPVPSGTRVTLEHRGWSKLRPDHPTRHGFEGQAFVDMIGLWWGELLVTFRLRPSSR